MRDLKIQVEGVIRIEDDPRLVRLTIWVPKDLDDILEQIKRIQGKGKSEAVTEALAHFFHIK